MDDLRVGDEDPRGIVRGPAVRLTFDGAPIDAFEGESVAAALLAADVRATRVTRRGGRPRGLFCGIGACHDCLVRVDGSGPVRSCLTAVRDGMHVTTHVLGAEGPS
jgi:predicted molibdopterin-dependent oxidoreductase YjgC